MVQQAEQKARRPSPAPSQRLLAAAMPSLPPNCVVGAAEPSRRGRGQERGPGPIADLGHAQLTAMKRTNHDQSGVLLGDGSRWALTGSAGPAMDAEGMSSGSSLACSQANCSFVRLMALHGAWDRQPGGKCGAGRCGHGTSLPWFRSRARLSKPVRSGCGLAGFPGHGARGHLRHAHIPKQQSALCIGVVAALQQERNPQ